MDSGGDGGAEEHCVALKAAWRILSPAVQEIERDFFASDEACALEPQASRGRMAAKDGIRFPAAMRGQTAMRRMAVGKSVDCQCCAGDEKSFV